MKISLCIPMYNETSIIADSAKTLTEYMTANFPGEYEIIFSDDGSTDGSADLVRGLELPGVRVVGYEKNRGKGCAVRTALLAAEGDIVMFTDADLAYGTDVIARVVETFDANPESGMVIGSRNLSADGYEGYTPLRRLMSKVYIRVLCLVGGFKLSDSQCGCKAFRRAAVQAIFPRCQVDGFAFDFEAILWAQKLGIKITEMPVKIINHRESKVRVLRDTVKMLGDLRRMRKRISAAEK
ncbi:MAG: glycosyltransferase [Ruminococcaceae bacterium]|nr:glycosyltransferase [Oscillospiraceae bacterium]